MSVGCSFTFEDALHKAGLVPRHALLNKNVPMYKTSYKLLPAGGESRVKLHILELIKQCLKAIWLSPCGRTPRP